MFFLMMPTEIYSKQVKKPSLKLKTVFNQKIEGENFTKS